MDDLTLIKKYYGENMMHFCRDNFPIILETEGLLFDILSNHFAYNKFLYDDIIKQHTEDEFKDFIYSLMYEEKVETTKTPKELLDEAGYILYECKTEEDIQSFKKYYALNEELCTFRGRRLDKCYVFFAVKKNVDEIKREDFSNPEREDEYGTSVISIQFSKHGTNVLSIKNRYNHRVKNPDATFGNNLENIIAGLTNSFEQTYNLNVVSINSNFELKNYVLAKDGKYYKYNYELNNIYYCPNNIIIDNFEVIDTYTQNERYIVFDYIVIDLQEKKIFLYDEDLMEGFIKRVKNIENKCKKR